jgi:prostaglandin-endoperoxide synthase 2
LKDRLKSYILTHFRPLWYLANNWSWLEKRVNRIFINSVVDAAPTRPHPFSTRSPYTSWDSLTDRSWNGRHLPAKQWGAQPDVNAVADLFMRPKGKPKLSPKSTLLFPSFAQWFTDGFLQTDSKNELKNTSIHEIALSQLYGVKPGETAAIRQLSGGRLKSQLIGGEEFAPYLYEDDGVTVKPEFANLPKPLRIDDPPPVPTEQRRTIFAFAGDRANTTAMTSMVSTLFLREHNRLCGVLQQKYPAWDDERLFQTARNIAIVMLIKIVVEEYINHISPFLFQIRADPSVAWTADWNRQNWIAVEFNLLYRWHSLVPDETQWPTGAMPTWEMIFNNKPLTDIGLGAAIDVCSRQPAGRIGLFNTPDFLRHVEIASIKQERIAQLASYNDYRALVGYQRVTQFDQITGDTDVQQALAKVYATPDDIEFYVGLFAEETGANSAVPSLIGAMVGLDAFSQALTNPLLSEHVFNADTFTPEGMQIITETDCLQDLLDRNTPAGGKFLATMTQVSA